MMINPKLLVVGAALAVCNLAARARREEQVAGEWQEYRKFGAETGTPAYVLAGLIVTLSNAGQRLEDLADELRSRRQADKVVALDRRRRGKDRDDPDNRVGHHIPADTLKHADRTCDVMGGRYQQPTLARLRLQHVLGVADVLEGVAGLILEDHAFEIGSPPPKNIRRI